MAKLFQKFGKIRKFKKSCLNFWWTTTQPSIVLEVWAWFFNDPKDLYFHLSLSSVSKSNIWLQKFLVDAPILGQLIVEWCDLTSLKSVMLVWINKTLRVFKKSNSIHIQYIIQQIWWNSGYESYKFDSAQNFLLQCIEQKNVQKYST